MYKAVRSPPLIGFDLSATPPTAAIEAILIYLKLKSWVTLQRLLYLNSIYYMSARLTTCLTQNLRSTPRLILLHSQLSATSFKPAALRTMATSIPKTMKGVVDREDRRCRGAGIQDGPPSPRTQRGRSPSEKRLHRHQLHRHVCFPPSQTPCLIRALTNTS